MGTNNLGNQEITFRFKQAAISADFNALMDSLIPTGIFSGGLLTKISNSAVQVSPAICFIQDTTTNSRVSARIQTQTSYTVNGVTTDNCYLVYKYTWNPTTTNYMDILAVNYSTLFSTQQTLNRGFILIGKAIYDGSVMREVFDYHFRSDSSLQLLENRKRSFYVKAYNDPTAKSIYVFSGNAVINGVHVNFPGQASVIANTTNGRIDIVYIDPDGNLNILQGSEPGTPYTIPDDLTVASFLAANPGVSIPDFPTMGMTVGIIIRGASRTTIYGRDIIQIAPERISYSGFEHDVTMQKDLTVQENLTINGTLTVNGTQTIIHTENLEVEDNIITLNSNFTSGSLPAGFQSGMLVKRGDDADYYFVHDNDTQSFKIGELASLQKLATREDVPQTRGVAFWNSTSERMDTDTYFLFNNSANSKALTIGNDSSNNRAAVTINGSLTVNNTGTVTINNVSTFNEDITITSPKEVHYKNEHLDVRFMHSSDYSGETTTANTILVDSGKQIKIFPNDGAGNIDVTRRTLEDAFLLKYNYTGNTSQTIKTDIFMYHVAGGETYDFTYKGDELDYRYIRTYALSSGEYPASTQNLYGTLNIKSEDSAVGNLNVDNILTVFNKIVIDNADDLTIDPTTSGMDFTSTSASLGYRFINPNGNLLEIDSTGNMTTLGNGIEITKNATGARNSYIDFHNADSPSDYTARIINPSGDTTLQFLGAGDYYFDANTYINGAMAVNSTDVSGYTFRVVGTARVTQGLSVVGNSSFSYEISNPAYSWSGSTTYPTLYSSQADHISVIVFPHIPYLKNGKRAYDGSKEWGSMIRLEAVNDDDSMTFKTNWDIGIGTEAAVGMDAFSISRGTTSLFKIDNAGDIDLPSPIMYSAITGCTNGKFDLGNNAFAAGAVPKFTPWMHYSDTVTGQKTNHYMIGSLRTGTGWADGGVVIGGQGHDSYPTKYFTFNCNTGMISHSDGVVNFGSSNITITTTQPYLKLIDGQDEAYLQLNHPSYNDWLRLNGSSLTGFRVDGFNQMVVYIGVDIYDALVVNTSSTNSGINIKSGTTSRGYVYYDATTKFSIGDTTAEANGLHMSGGYFGIGTAASSSYKLFVSGAKQNKLYYNASGVTDVLIVESSTGSTGINLRSNSSSRGYFWYDTATHVGVSADSDSVNFLNGNVGVGGNPDAQSYKLQVTGGFKSSGGANLGTGSSYPIGIGPTTLSWAGDDDYVTLYNTALTERKVMICYPHVPFLHASTARGHTGTTSGATMNFEAVNTDADATYKATWSLGVGLPGELLGHDEFGLARNSSYIFKLDANKNMTMPVPTAFTGIRGCTYAKINFETFMALDDNYPYFIPWVHGATESNMGYHNHHSIGMIRSDKFEGGSFYIGGQGHDNYPTSYFFFNCANATFGHADSSNSVNHHFDLIQPFIMSSTSPYIQFTGTGGYTRSPYWQYNDTGTDGGIYAGGFLFHFDTTAAIFAKASRYWFRCDNADAKILEVNYTGANGFVGIRLSNGTDTSRGFFWYDSNSGYTWIGMGSSENSISFNPSNYIGIGGTPDTTNTYRCKVNGNLKVTGSINVDGFAYSAGITAGDYIIMNSVHLVDGGPTEVQEYRVQYSGTYRIATGIRQDGTGSNDINVYIYKNDVYLGDPDYHHWTNSSSYVWFNNDVSLVAGDCIQIMGLGHGNIVSLVKTAQFGMATLSTA